MAARVNGKYATSGIRVNVGTRTMHGATKDITASKGGLTMSDSTATVKIPAKIQVQVREEQTIDVCARHARIEKRVAPGIVLPSTAAEQVDRQMLRKQKCRKKNGPSTKENGSTSTSI